MCTCTFYARNSTIGMYNSSYTSLPTPCVSTIFVVKDNMMKENWRFVNESQLQHIQEILKPVHIVSFSCRSWYEQTFFYGPSFYQRSRKCVKLQDCKIKLAILYFLKFYLDILLSRNLPIAVCHKKKGILWNILMSQITIEYSHIVGMNYKSMFFQSRYSGLSFRVILCYTVIIGNDSKIGEVKWP